MRLRDPTARYSWPGDKWLASLPTDLWLRSTPASKRSLRLLPHFDPYLLAHHEKEHLVAPEQYKRVYRKAGWISPVLLWNGRVVGVWSHERRGGLWKIEVEPFEELSKTIRNLIQKEAKRLGRFLRLDPEIRFAG